MFEKEDENIEKVDDSDGEAKEEGENDDAW